MQPTLQKILADSTDGWSQTQKEALVDLCLLGMYADNLLSLAEQAFIEDKFENLQWESGIPFRGYLQRTIPKIRLARDDSKKVQQMLEDIKERLGSDEYKQKSFEVLNKLLATDELVKVEEKFSSEVRGVMGI